MRPHAQTNEARILTNSSRNLVVPRQLLEGEDHRTRNRIGDTEATAKVFKCIPKGIQSGNHGRPSLCECVRVGPFGNDAIGTLARLDHVGMSEARPIGLGILMGIEEFLLASRFHPESHGVESGHDGSFIRLWRG